MTDSSIAAAFLHWQCQLRKIAVREHEGRPGSGITPVISSAGGTQHGITSTRVVTVLNKLPQHEMLAELKHIYYKNLDPALRRQSVVKLLSERYYQNPGEFSDRLCATFARNNTLVNAHAQDLIAEYSQFNQGFTVPVRVQQLEASDYAYQATFWHNILFNPNLPQDAVVLQFIPDWSRAQQH